MTSPSVTTASETEPFTVQPRAPGSTTPVGVILLARTETCWSAWVGECFESCQGIVDHVGPGPVACESQTTSARQSPPNATTRATSSRILPGSCTALGRSHGVSAAKRLVQPGLADRFDQQHGTGLGHHRPATTLNADARIRPDTLLHLGSASDGGRNKDLDNPHSCWSEALFAYLTTRRTARFMKARG
jgi:hypothetical protein